MGFGKKILFLLTALFLLAAGYAGHRETMPDGFLSLDVTCGDRTENIKSLRWNHDYCLYLPSGADIGSAQLRFGEKGNWALNGRELTDRTPCMVFPINTEMILTEDGEEVGTVTIFQSANVGAMFVDTVSGNMKHIHEVKGNEEAGTLRLYDQQGALAHDGVIVAINGRGNSTWNEEKKSYSLELAREADLLGMGSAEKWILLSNSLDSTHLHNKVVYEFARDFGLAYSPDCDWVDLYLNGEYAGLYLLCERNEVHPRRVDISLEDSFLVARDAYWRFEEGGKPYITTESKAALRIYHGGMDTARMLATIQSAENAILAEDGIDPVTGKTWQELIDVDSWVRKYLVDEVFANRDATSLSQFYYYDGSDGTGKIYAGPVWDYDLSMYFDAEDWQETVRQFYANIPNVYGSKWPGELYRKPEFYEQVVRLYGAEILPLLEWYQQNVIPAYAERIADAALMNASRWGQNNEKSAVQEMQVYLEMRRDFLNDVWLEGTRYCYVRATLKSGSSHYFAVKPGNLLPRQLWYESEDPLWEYRWYDYHTGECVDLNAPIDSDREIYVRYEPISQSEETEPVPEETQELSRQEEKIEEAPVQAEPEPDDIPEGEKIPTTRLLPAAVFVLMLAAVFTAGIIRCFADKRKM